jgi:putative transposase
MKRSRFSEEQIIGILKEHQAGLSAAELCRKHGVSEPTFYKWRSKYGGMEVSDAKRLKALEEENAKLKKLLAESMLDGRHWRAIGPSDNGDTLREMLGKNF